MSHFPYCVELFSVSCDEPARPAVDDAGIEVNGIRPFLSSFRSVLL
jgi:hypothetical protein